MILAECSRDFTRSDEVGSYIEQRKLKYGAGILSWKTCSCFMISDLEYYPTCLSNE